MSKGSAKERGRVRIGGRVSTLRVIDGFGSWKHNYYVPNEGPTIRQLGRRLIGRKNGGRKLAVNSRPLELRKPTDRICNNWSLKTFRYQNRSTIKNRAALRRGAKKLVEIELVAIDELRKDELTQSALKEKIDQEMVQETLAEIEREWQEKQKRESYEEPCEWCEEEKRDQQLREENDQNEKRGLELSEHHKEVLRVASENPQKYGFFPHSY